MSFERVLLGEVTAPRALKANPGDQPDLEYVGLEHVKSHTGELVATVPASTMKSSSAVVRAGDVMYGRLRPYLNKVHVAKHDYLASAEFIVLPPSPRIRSDFLTQLLRSPDFLAFTALLDTGDRPRVNWNGIKKYSFELPPLDVQQRIVETLEDHLSRVEKALAELEDAKTQLIQARRAILHEAFSSGSSGTWESLPLGAVARVQGGATPKGLAAVASVTRTPSSDIPFFKVAEMNFDPRYLRESRTYISQTEADRLKISVIEEGSLVFPKAGGAIATNKKRIVQVPGGVDTNCMAVTPHSALSAEFLQWFFESFDLMDISNGSILPQISKKTVEALQIPMPTLEDQERIVHSLQDQLGRLHSMALALDDVEKKSGELRRALLHSAFSGQLTNEEPND